MTVAGSRAACSQKRGGLPARPLGEGQMPEAGRRRERQREVLFGELANQACDHALGDVGVVRLRGKSHSISQNSPGES